MRREKSFFSYHISFMIMDKQNLKLVGKYDSPIEPVEGEEVGETSIRREPFVVHRRQGRRLPVIGYRRYNAPNGLSGRFERLLPRGVHSLINS
jgi:hypothetical protein